MRVIAGRHRSRLLIEVNSESTRETKDRIKEAIFNSIGPYFHDETVLDLFSGSGSLGIEALSRGAQRTTFIDDYYLAIKTIKQNIANLGLELESIVYKTSSFDFLQKAESSYDLIFLDPPYNLKEIDNIIALIAERKLLNEDGKIVCLYDKFNSVKKENNGIIEYKLKSIGKTKVSFMKWGI